MWPFSSGPKGYEDLSVGDASQRLADFQLIDVREPSEYDGPLGHIAGTTLVPLQTVAGHLDQLDRDKPVLLICRSGGRSGAAAGMLAKNGFGEVYNLAGGMMAWNAAGLPVER